MILFGIAGLYAAYNFINGVLKHPEEFLQKHYTILIKDIFGEDFAKNWFMFFGVISGLIGIFLFLLALYLLFFETQIYRVE